MCGRCRYQRGSEVCQKLAESLEYLTGQEDRGLFDFGRRAGEPAPLMLLLDRCAPGGHRGLSTAGNAALMVAPPFDAQCCKWRGRAAGDFPTQFTSRMSDA